VTTFWRFATKQYFLRIQQLIAAQVISKHTDEGGNHVSTTNKVTLQTVINTKTFSVLSQKPDGITIRITKTFF